MDAADSRPKDKCFKCGKPSVGVVTAWSSVSSACIGALCEECTQLAEQRNAEVQTECADVIPQGSWALSDLSNAAPEAAKEL
jgi:hypothetical protein